MFVMRFSPDEQIIVKGETGTWWGILITGSLRVKVPQVRSCRFAVH